MVSQPEVNHQSQNPKKSKVRLCFMPSATETGDTWDECLDGFKTGSININYYNNVIGYTAGECVSGTLDIVLTEKLSC